MHLLEAIQESVGKTPYITPSLHFTMTVQYLETANCLEIRN